MPRRVAVFLEAPPGDGLRVAQDHFAEYVKPVLASSGLDWEFVVGRREGDVRAVVAERVRRSRRAVERDIGQTVPEEMPTEDEAIQAVRKKNGIMEFEGIKGDIVLGRHTWKEYVRGLHEGWLGPLAPPPEPEGPSSAAPTSESESAEEDKPKVPLQPQPFITTVQYPSSHPPLFIPAEFDPSTTIPFPHILGFLNTPTRMHRFFTRRYLADQIGREVAAVCFRTYREFREENDTYEQQGALLQEEKDWVKSVWKEEEPPKAPEGSEEGDVKKTEPPKERIWASPMVLDLRIAVRMRRFELLPEDEARARQIVVPEEQVEGWTKGTLRQLWRWGAQKWKGGDKKVVDLGNVDDAE